jgi:PAS domain S-box-containing protein
MDESPSLRSLPFGLFELDEAGTVIAFSPAAERYSEVRAADVVGRNFFTEVLTPEQSGELQGTFNSMMPKVEAVERLTSFFPSEQGEVKVQMVLAHLPQKEGEEKKRLALVRLMPEEGAA